ncbi:HEXXH motif-containing putative peptide modification protein [Streptomyces sp. NPDC006654]|uniref:aKG-HExxH-type peptide beta-hydroxylase n=1 Tax=Streptomyces sp. NPDC006654 TaxID=3156897 RepID=UPI0033E8193A
MFPQVPEPALAELGRTEGGADTLALLIRDQDTRRLLLLRAVLDAVQAADPALCPPAAKARLRADWTLLTEADRTTTAATPGPSPGAAVPEPREGTAAPGASAGAGVPGGAGWVAVPGASAGAGAPAGVGAPGAGVGGAGPAAPAGAAAFRAPAESAVPGSAAGAAAPDTPAGVTASRLRGWEGVPGAAGVPGSAARARLCHPLLGPWARRCLAALDPRSGVPVDERRRELARDLDHFSAVAAVAAARAGIGFTTDLTARDGLLVLPSLGALRTAGPRVRVAYGQGRLTLDRTSVFLEHGSGAWSGSLAWTSAYALPGLVPGAAPVPLDDLDPYRVPPREPDQYALSGPAAPDDAERKRWLQSWTGTAAALRTGGEGRLTEALALLRCLVPLEMPPGSAGRGSCSGTRREAFGALLSSLPATPAAFAATLVHEFQHTKLAALSELVELHRAGPAARYFAPWRPDPRPYDGLFQGAYSHLALADFFQRRALGGEPAHSESAWAQYARYHAQVGAALPALVASPDLTPVGRRFVDEMAATHERLAAHPAPSGHTARAQAYVKAVRALWTQRQPRGESR